MKTNKNYTSQEEFFSLDFFVNQYVLRPRNETEIMVYQILKSLKSPQVTYIDVGTGSGCILTAVVKNLPLSLTSLYATDLSQEALKVAQMNFHTHGVSPQIIPSNLLECFIDPPLGEKYSFEKDVVLSANLPYIKNGDFENMSKEVLENEPHSALFGGEETGFELYEALIDQIPLLMERYSINQTTIFIEIGFDQYEYSREYLTKKGLKFEYFQDFGNIWRIIKIIFFK